MQQIKSNRGGHRQGAGRPKGPRRNLILDQETAKGLFLLVRYRQAQRITADPGILTNDELDLTEEEIVARLVTEEWRRIREATEPKAEEAREPFIL